MMSTALFPRLSSVFLLLLAPLAAHGRQWIVTPGEGPRSLSIAVERAGDGDTLRIKPGTYRESGILVGKRLALVGEGYPVLDAEGQGQIVTVVADGVRIQGLDIRNVGVSHIEDRAGVKLVGVKDCIIEGNRLVDTFFGIYLENSERCVVEKNLIAGSSSHETSSGNGIHMWHSRDILVAGNDVKGHRDGIYLEFVTGSRIVGNRAEGNLRYGLHFMFSHNNVYENNVFSENGAGVAVMFSDSVTMVENIFAHNWGPASYGLLLKDIRMSVIGGNEFVHNTIGIYCEGSSKLTLAGNQFTGNGYAVKMMASATGNSLTQNNFRENTFDIATNSRQNFNDFDGNYWSGYRGYDLDMDGVGDVPHRPVHLFSLLVEQEPAGLILLRSFLVDVLDAAERVLPLFTPENLMDRRPLMGPVPVRGAVQ